MSDRRTYNRFKVVSSNKFKAVKAPRVFDSSEGALQAVTAAELQLANRTIQDAIDNALDTRRQMPKTYSEIVLDKQPSKLSAGTKQLIEAIDLPPARIIETQAPRTKSFYRFQVPKLARSAHRSLPDQKKTLG